VPLWNQFSRPRTGSLAVETQRSGSRAGNGSEPALKMLWWKRGFKWCNFFSQPLTAKLSYYGKLLSVVCLLGQLYKFWGKSALFCA